MPSYEPQNTFVCTRHSKMFKHDAFTFHPNDDLVMSLPFKFIEDLEVSKYTLLEKSWLKRLHANLKKSEQNSIERIRLVRLIKPFDLKNTSNEYKNVDEGIIYKVYMDGSSMLVSHAEIGDIIGDEQWLAGELKCISNMASNQIVNYHGVQKKGIIA
jgi:hypothetical protein